MKRAIVLGGTLLLVFSTSAFGIDWGGSLTNSSTVQSVADGSDENTFVQSNRLTGYVSGNLMKNIFLIQGAVQLADDPVIAADIEKAYLSKTVNPEDGNLLSYQRRIGRFLLADPTGQVMSQVVDGAAVSFGRQRSELRIAGGYTGLVSKHFANLSMSKLDGVDDADDEQSFAPGRFVAQLVYTLPEVILGQNVTLATVIQEDLRDPDSVIEEGTLVADAESGSGGLVDTQYGIIRVDGPVPVVNNLYYSTSFVLNTGRMLSSVSDVDLGDIYRYQAIRAHLFRLGVRYYMPWFFSSRVSGSVLVSSGDSDFAGFVEGNTAGKAQQFVPINPGSNGSVFGLQTGNSTIAAVSFATQPFVGNALPILDKFQGVVSMLQFYRSAGEGVVSASEVDSAASGSYLGTEVDVAARFRPYSDLGFGVSGGLLLKNEDVLLAGAESTDFVLRLNASLSF